MSDRPRRLRIYSGRHPYGSWSWGYEIIDPGRPVDSQVLTGMAWFSTWRQAWSHGTTELRRYGNPASAA